MSAVHFVLWVWLTCISTLNHTIVFIKSIWAVSSSITQLIFRDALWWTRAKNRWTDTCQCRIDKRRLCCYSSNRIWKVEIHLLNITHTGLWVNKCHRITSMLLHPHKRLTAVDLIRAIQAVSLPITQEFFRDAAAAIGTAMLAAPGWCSAVLLVWLILTLCLPVAHLSLRDAHLTMRALKLTWGGAHIHSAI